MTKHNFCTAAGIRYIQRGGLTEHEALAAPEALWEDADETERLDPNGLADSDMSTWTHDE